MPINLFDANFYRAANVDLSSLNDAQAWSHFQTYGLNEGRAFSAFVDLSFYRACNGDLASFSNRQLFEHLSAYGIAEGRKFSQFVDLGFYRASNGDLASLNNEQIFDHLRNNGVSEGRIFSPFLNVNFYLADNADLAQAYGGNKLAALQHYEIYGLKEGRRSSVAFDVNQYRNANSDLIAAGLNNKQLLEHVQNYGVAEGRVTSNLFNVKTYLQNNADLVTAFGSNTRQAYNHFVSYGLNEGRIASPAIAFDYSGNQTSAARNIGIQPQKVTFRESVNDGDTNDFYRFSVSAQKNVLNLALNGLSANADLELLNEAGQVIASSRNGGASNESIALDNLDPGTYYVRVYQGSGGANSNYNLSLSATAPFSSQTNSNQSNNGGLAPQSNLANLVQRVLELTNAERAKANLQPLLLNQNLSNAAQSHSEDMAMHDFFSHTGSKGSSTSDRARVAGYQFSFVGENIAAGQVTPEQVVEAWMNSPGHRSNILNASYREMGIGYYYLQNDTGNTNYQYYWTQDFGAVAS